MSDSQLAIGVDFGATTVKAGVIYQSHVIDSSPVIATAEFRTPDELIDAMVRSVEGLRKSHRDAAALGVGVAGFVDFERGLVHDLPNVPDWNSIRLRQILQERTGLPTTVDNLGNCMAVAEWKCGAARGRKDVLFVKLETGLGGAIIANGKLIRCACNVGGEIGQASLDWQGRRGKFGNRGALEEYLGLAQIKADTCAAYAAAGIEKELCDCSIRALITAAHRGDPVACARWEELAGMLASVVMSSCWLLNPEAVVIGGSIANAGDLLFKPLRERVFGQLSDPFRDRLLIIPSVFGIESGMVGAAALALDGAELRAGHPV